MTYNYEQDQLELGKCWYGCSKEPDIVYHELPQKLSKLNSYTCGKANRDSTLCGSCKSGFSPLAYSYDMSCMNCTGMTYSWIKYIAAAYIPLTVFFFFVVCFKFNGTSPLLRGSITICQGLASPMNIKACLIVNQTPFIEYFIRVLASIIGIWNLDFFRTVLPPICLDISPLQTLSLDYAIAFYPLLLVLVTYLFIHLHSRDVQIIVLLWKPFHKLFRLIKEDWDLEGSVVKAFATFFMISFLKILNVTVDLLIYTEKYVLPLGEQTFQVTYVPYYDASVEYMRKNHLYYGVTALIVGALFVILPLVFLVIYPMGCFQRCLNFIGIQRRGLDILVNCYQGYYKDGTDGTRDYRCFSITFFLIQITIFSIFILSKSVYCFPLGALITMIFVFIVLAVQPYKEQFKAYSTIDAFMLLIIGSVCMIITAADEANTKSVQFSTPTYVLAALVSLIPSLYMTGLIIWWIFVKKKLKLKLPCFQVQDPLQLQESYDFPDRIENPDPYQAETVPILIGVSQQLQDGKYGPAHLH